LATTFPETNADAKCRVHTLYRRRHKVVDAAANLKYLSFPVDCDNVTALGAAVLVGKPGLNAGK
jgi:hypothetical protein